jgi:hypothetical protein
MKRFAIEHLPRSSATYTVRPVETSQARGWLAAGDVVSLVRTTELAGAISAGLGVTLEQADQSMTLQPGDTALLISLSFSVLLAWAEGNIVPLDEDWRCLILHVENPQDTGSSLVSAVSDDLAAESSELT